MTAVDIKVANPQSLENDTMDIQDLRNRHYWQHNLPLMNKSSDESDVSWKNHNPNKRIGAWFVWGRSWPYYWETSQWKWESFFPGTTAWGTARPRASTVDGGLAW